MKKILLSAALITGLIAPAIFAATQYTSYNTQHNTQHNTQPKSQAGMSSSGSSGSGKILRSTQSCMKSVLAEYEKEKESLSNTYKENYKYLIKKTSTGAVSGEKSLRAEKLKGIQKDYRTALLKLKSSTLAKQRICTKN